VNLCRVISERLVSLGACLVNSVNPDFVQVTILFDNHKMPVKVSNCDKRNHRRTYARLFKRNQVSTR
jgi:hypothetical protein